jgi:Ala-tRNA(Pro) deacylase
MEVIMPIHTLTELLDRHNIKYTIITHSPAYTAQGIAALTHIPGQEMAKTVIVNIDDALTMVVLPASCQVDLAALRRATRANSVTLAREKDFLHRFPACETGAMPPFGNLYGMNVFVDESLTQDKEIAFNAGSHWELMRLAYEDFARVVQPMVLRFALARARAA